MKIGGAIEDEGMVFFLNKGGCAGTCPGWVAVGNNNCSYHNGVGPLPSGASAGDQVYQNESDCKCGAYGIC